MDSSLDHGTPEYLGADLTDRYSNGCRDVDVCGLTHSGDDKLKASFWFWRWDAAPNHLDVKVIAKELSATRASMLDGPQGLAATGTALRGCERQSAAVGKTPDTPPSLAKPFAGFIRSSLDLFAALRQAGVKISPSGFLDGVSEVYPGHIWTLLAGRRAIPKKSTREGRLVRKQILEALGVSSLPDLPTHDQNDACVAALLGAAADGNVPGIMPRAIGSRLFTDADGTLREGQMVIPDVTAETAERISALLGEAPVADVAICKHNSVTPLASTRLDDCASELLDRFVLKALEGNAEICTYSWAYRRLFGAYERWSQAYARQVIELALRTSPRELPGLGIVRLDAFVVAKDTGLPNVGHWPSAQYDREDWERILGTAVVLGQ